MPPQDNPDELKPSSRPITESVITLGPFLRELPRPAIPKPRSGRLIRICWARQACKSQSTRGSGNPVRRGVCSGDPTNRPGKGRAMKWQFYRQKPTDPVLNPIAGEFFSSEAVGDSASALVREAVQNSLDARDKSQAPPGSPVRVRVFLSAQDDEVSAKNAKRWFDGIWPHVKADKNGLVDRPDKSDGCPYIVIEDFGTLGLGGDPEAYVPAPDTPNDFLNFFRAFGHSDKAGHSKGSWGVGKTVFPRSSRISSFFGYTVRAKDTKRMLLGRSILKYHRCGTENFKSDGYYGCRRDDDFVLPSRDPDEIEAFKSTFRLTRTIEPGLSVVIPWYIHTGDGAISGSDVTRAVAEGFFIPLLSGDLQVDVVEVDHATTLNTATLEDTVRSHRGKWVNRLLPIVRMARWWIDQKGKCAVEVHEPDPTRAQKWTPDSLDSGMLATLIELSNKKEPFAVRVPLTIRRKGATPSKTHFTVICESAGDDDAGVIFVRDGLIISDVRPTRVIRGVRAIVVVEDEELAGFLRDAETPAHTEWNPGTANFKSKYVWGPSAIDYVRAAVPELYAAIRKTDSAPDRSLTLDHFFLERPREQKPAERIKNRKPLDTTDPLPPKKPARFEITRQAGGFIVRNPPASPEATSSFTPFRIRVRVAYDIRKRSPLSSWSTYDFDLSRSAIRISESGLTIQAKSGNELIARIDNDEFQLAASGFDTTRDLFVDVRVLKEESDDNP
jgi:hypothetical protein